MHSQNIFGFCGIVFELGTKQRDMVVYSSCRRESIITPHFVQEFIAGEDLPDARGEQSEHTVLFSGEIQPPSTFAGLEALEVYLDISKM